MTLLKYYFLNYGILCVALATPSTVSMVVLLYLGTGELVSCLPTAWAKRFNLCGFGCWRIYVAPNGNHKQTDRQIDSSCVGEYTLHSDLQTDNIKAMGRAIAVYHSALP